MILTGMRGVLAAVLAMVVVLLGMSGSAHAGDGRSVRSVCETGYRGMPQYDALCLVRGTRADASALWYRDAEGDRLSKRERRAVCRDARHFSSLRVAVREWYIDVAYDSYRNYRTVLRYTKDVARKDCRTLGVRTH